MSAVTSGLRPPHRTLQALLLSSLPLLAGCAGDGGELAGIPRGGPLVIVSIDTLRSDRLPAYGYDAVETPAIDSLRAEGILFERAYTHVPLTLPAHASLMTGLLPPAHGVRDNGGYTLAEGAGTTLAEQLDEAGYATGGAISAFVLRRETGIARGFEHWDDDLGGSARMLMGDIQRSGSDTLRAAFDWVDTVGERPFLLFFHIYEPHVPRTPPEPFRSRYADPYDGEVAAADAVIGELLAGLRERGLYDGSTIVLLSDHGEGLGDHQEDEHGILLYRESLQVPLIVKLPGSRLGGDAVAEPVQLVDVTPTLLELAGVEPPAALPGTSLLRFLPAAGVPPELAARDLYSETFHPQLAFGWSALTSVVRGRHHYIEGVDRELFDLVADPGERRNLVRTDRRAYAALRNALDGFDRRLELPFEEDTETRQALAALGYLGGGAAAGDGEPIDPKTRVADLRLLRKGIALVMDERNEEAIPMLRQAIAALPESDDAWQFLGLALQKTARPAEALAAYQKALELTNGSPHLGKPMAHLAFQLGHWDDAAAFVALSTEDDPENWDLRLLRVRALIFSGRLDEARSDAQAVVRASPESSDAHYYLGAAQMGLRQLEAAEGSFRRALELDPESSAALSDLAVLLMSQGRRAEAAPLLEHLARLRPRAQERAEGQSPGT
jgi:arylsulfatase A-like enzyme/Flp pilus assembly protein TadD